MKPLEKPRRAVHAQAGTDPHAQVAMVFALVWAVVAAACSDDVETLAASGTTGPGGADTGGGGASNATTGSTSTGLPASFEVTGVVVDQEGVPQPGAIVMQGGAAQSFLAAADGSFSLTLSDAVLGERVAVAAKVGYRSAGEAFDTVPEGPVTLVLYEIKEPDNALGYSFGAPGIGDAAVDNSTKFCGHCHTTFAREFNASAHARATKNPKVQDQFAGVASALTSESACTSAGGTWRTGALPGTPGQSLQRCYIGSGVLPDLNTCGQSPSQSCDDPSLPAALSPTAFGACADCHGFGMDGPSGGRNLLDAEGVGYEFGVHCDACHHVRDVDLAAPPGGAGRLVMQRPREKTGDRISGPIRQAMFGPYADVPNSFMGGSVQPKFSTADFCAGCHEQKQAALLPGASLAPRFAAGLPIHSTFSEWQEGAWGGPGTPCQHCHMPPRFGLTNSIDVTTPENVGVTYGFERQPEATRSHSFRGPLTKIDGVFPRLLDAAVTLGLTTNVSSSQLDVAISLNNVGCGHAIPTGEPMRSLILVVNVSGCGQDFVPISGQTIDDVGGALGQGIVGTDLTIVGNAVAWPAADGVAEIGQHVRVVRQTGSFLDYDGVGLFEAGLLPANEKGIELIQPVDEAAVVAVNGSTLTLDKSLTFLPGDSILLVDARPALFSDGAPSSFLSGLSGATFSKVLLDPAGVRRVPQHRGVDVASDNRLRPFTPAQSEHSFAIPFGCNAAEVRATLLYRPHPVDLASLRGWEARDYLAGESVETVSLP